MSNVVARRDARVGAIGRSRVASLVMAKGMARGDARVDAALGWGRVRTLVMPKVVARGDARVDAALGWGRVRTLVMPKVVARGDARLDAALGWGRVPSLVMSSDAWAGADGRIREARVISNAVVRHDARVAVASGCGMSNGSVRRSGWGAARARLRDSAYEALRGERLAGASS